MLSSPDVSVVIPSKKKSHRKLSRGSHDEVMSPLRPEFFTLQLFAGTVAAEARTSFLIMNQCLSGSLSRC